jgi:hypothetical protein
MGPHRLDLADRRTELAKCADAADRVTVPRRPDCYIRLLQPGQIERKDVAGRRVLVHAREVNAQQILGSGIGEIVRPDLHVLFPACLDALRAFGCP